MDLASVVAALASVGVRVSGSTPNNNIQGDSSRACPTGLAGPEPSGTDNDPGQHFQRGRALASLPERSAIPSRKRDAVSPEPAEFYWIGGVCPVDHGGLARKMIPQPPRRMALLPKRSLRVPRHTLPKCLRTRTAPKRRYLWIATVMTRLPTTALARRPGLALSDDRAGGGGPHTHLAGASLVRKTEE